MTYSFLALGDSYTIGEGLPIYESFPYQAVQILREAGISFSAPEIIARTGWTTDELNDRIAETKLLPAYDFVSLLIGVNNEYRGRSPREYATQFEELLQQAIQFAGKQPARVFVLSIPDWGVSPFADSSLPDTAGRDRAQIAREVDAFNGIAEKIAGQYQIDFIDITANSRAVARELAVTDGVFASDGLHPSGQQYRYWAEQLAGRIEARLVE
jgi:lysophospholipase L1-like esterase